MNKAVNRAGEKPTSVNDEKRRISVAVAAQTSIKGGWISSINFVDRT
jgi:hypothetical protein